MWNMVDGKEFSPWKLFYSYRRLKHAKKIALVCWKVNYDNFSMMPFEDSLLNNSAGSVNEVFSGIIRNLRHSKCFSICSDVNCPSLGPISWFFTFPLIGSWWSFFSKLTLKPCRLLGLLVDFIGCLGMTIGGIEAVIVDGLGETVDLVVRLTFALFDFLRFALNSFDELSFVFLLLESIK